jgi:hypothetical protein
MAAKVFPNVVLHTDIRGKALLVDALGLPFTCVETALEDVPAHFRHVYPIGKLLAYQRLAHAGTPFVHFDYDFILWERDRWEQIKDSPAVCQNFNGASPALLTFAAQLFAQDPNLAGTRPAVSVCAGALGGNDTARLAAYADKALELASNPAVAALVKQQLATSYPHFGPCSLEEVLFAHYFPDAAGFLPFCPFRHVTSDSEWAAAGISHSMATVKCEPLVKKRHARYVRLGFPAYGKRADTLFAGFDKTP